MLLRHEVLAAGPYRQAGWSAVPLTTPASLSVDLVAHNKIVGSYFHESKCHGNMYLCDLRREEPPSGGFYCARSEMGISDSVRAATAASMIIALSKGNA